MRDTDEYLRSVTIGERKPHNDTIHLEPYDPNWPRQFAELERRIRRVLTDRIIMLEHVGSTSVPGLSAKPVIDMVLVVDDSTDEASYVPPLESEGFVLRIREPDWFEHRLLKAPEIAGHLHVFSEGCEEVENMLLLRDWIREQVDERALYERTKQELAARRWRDVDHYARAKSKVVGEILNRAQNHSPKADPKAEE